MTDFRRNDPNDDRTNQEIRDCHELEMRQQPQRARIVVRGKEKGKYLSFTLREYAANNNIIDRKPVDPPPIVQLRVVNDPYNEIW